MRKRWTVVIALFVGLLGVLLASSSVAQERTTAGQPKIEGQFALEIAGGVGVPLGQLGGTALLTAHPGDSGLDEHRGWNGHVGADFYMTSFLTAGLWMGQCTLDTRDQVVTTSGATRSYSQLVRGTSSMLGLRVKGYLPMRGTWSPYVALGMTHFHRKADLSKDMRVLYPTISVFEITDDKMGVDLGTGFEYRVAPHVGMGVGATYFYSSAFGHQVPWMGSDRILHNWEYWTVEARLTLHVPGMPAR